MGTLSLRYVAVVCNGCLMSVYYYECKLVHVSKQYVAGLSLIGVMFEESYWIRQQVMFILWIVYVYAKYGIFTMER